MICELDEDLEFSDEPIKKSKFQKKFNVIGLEEDMLLFIFINFNYAI